MGYSAEIFGRNGKHAVCDESNKGRVLFYCTSFADAHNATRLLESLEDDGEEQDALLSSWDGDLIDSTQLLAQLLRYGVEYR